MGQKKVIEMVINNKLKKMSSSPLERSGEAKNKKVREKLALKCSD